MRLSLPIAIAALLSASAASANVITVGADDVGQSYTINYDGFADGGTIEGLTAQSLFTLTGVTDTSFTFDYDVTNTSSSPINESRVTIFGFNADPNASSASSTGTFDNAVLSSNAPGGLRQVDICFNSGDANNCSGGGGGGVSMGETGSGTFTLNFSEALDQLSLSDFFVRYQSVNGEDSAVGRGTLGGDTGGSTGGSTGGTPVPAPAALALFTIGAAGVMARRTRRA